MADITLTYKGNTIAEISDSGTKTLETGGTYCEADIELEYVRPSGGTPTPVTVTIATTTNAAGAHQAIQTATGFSSYFCINTSATNATGKFMLYGGAFIKFPLPYASNFYIDSAYRKTTADAYGSSTMNAAGTTVVRSGDVFLVWSLDFLEESYEQDN